MTANKPLVSIVSPVYEEEEALPHFHRALAKVLDGLADEYDAEIILVDDGSRDGTLPLLRRLAREDARVRYYSFSRNFGHQAALTAGLERARGDVVVTLDSDLQHPPALIPTLLRRWREGSDTVVTIRGEDRTLGLFKRLSSRYFYALMGRLSDVEIRPAAADFRLMSRRAVEAVLRMRETHQFLRGMVQWVGFQSAEVRFDPDPRRAGQSKFTLLRLSSLGFDALLSFSRTPRRLPLYLGLASGAAGAAYAAFLLLSRLAFGRPVETADLALLSLYLVGSAVLFSLGVVGEYAGRIYEQVKGRPLYVVKESIEDAVAAGSERTDAPGRGGAAA